MRPTRAHAPEKDGGTRTMAGKHFADKKGSRSSRRPDAGTPEGNSLVDEVLAADMDGLDALTADLRTFRTKDFVDETRPVADDPAPTRVRKRRAETTGTIKMVGGSYPATTVLEDARDPLASIPDPLVETAPASVAPADGAAGFGGAASTVLNAIPSEQLESYEPEPRHGSTGKALLGVIGGLIAVAGLAYAGGVFYFMGHFMPNTLINGADVSMASIENVGEALAREVDSYSLHISGSGIDTLIASSDIGLSLDASEIAADVHAQQDPWTWPLRAMSVTNLIAQKAVSYDEGRLSQLIGDAVAAANEGSSEPVAATLAYDETVGRFTVIPEVPGTALDAQAVLAKAVEAVSSLDPEVEVDADSLIMPEVTRDDPRLIEAAEQANRYMIGPVTLNIPNGETAELSPDIIRTWIDLDEDLNASYHPERIIAWTRGEFSDAWDTVGTKRSYTRSDGKKIEVEGGDYGWNVNGTEFAAIIEERIAAGSSDPIDVPFYSVAGKHVKPGEADWGDTFLDVDLTEQHVRYYKDGKIIWESDCVTGDLATKRETPEGIYVTNDYRQRDVVLIGADEDKDGKPDYESKVKYWMPFIDNNYGLHDADWRWTFGEDIYKYAGSHGCVNLPVEKAAELWEILPPGVPVVLHS